MSNILSFFSGLFLVNADPTDMNHNNSTAINNNTASSSTNTSLSLGQHSFRSFQPQSFVSDTDDVDNVGVTHEKYRKKRSKRIVIGGEDGGDGSTPTALKPPRSGTKKPAEPSTFTSKATTRPTCSECGKQFMSWKALFGHMRCHPERQWRGMNPPQKLQRISNQDVGAGRTKEDEDIATCLLLLSKGGGSQPISCDMDGSKMLHPGGPSAPPDTDGTGQLHLDSTSYTQVFGSTPTIRQGEPGGNGHEHERLITCRRQREKSDGGMLDLNLPAPVETPTNSCSSNIELGLDLKLGV